MRVLLLTVAGTSSRFSRSLGKEYLKCIYCHSNIAESLLYRMLHQSKKFDKYIIVGGFMYEQLKMVIEKDFLEFGDQIILVNNKKYAEYGSGYSLYKGLQEIMKLDFDEVIFAEGDLYVDGDTFGQIVESKKDVITCNKEAVWAEKSVAFYFDMQYQIHYIYDTSHNALEINEPFLGIFNSGQVWKFVQPDRLREIYASMDEKDWEKTNLVLIQRYFQSLKRDEYNIVQFENWVNCNTISDFERISSFEKG